MTRLGSVILALPLLAAAQSYNLSALFQSVLSPGAEIYYANDSNWAQDVTQRWTTWDAPTYMGAIKPVTERDIQNIVCIHKQIQTPELFILTKTRLKLPLLTTYLSWLLVVATASHRASLTSKMRLILI